MSNPKLCILRWKKYKITFWIFELRLKCELFSYGSIICLFDDFLFQLFSAQVQRATKPKAPNAPYAIIIEVSKK